MGDPLKLYNVTYASESFDPKILAEYFAHEGFFAIYNISESSFSIACKSTDTIPGLGLEETNKADGGKFTYLVAYPLEDMGKKLELLYKFSGKVIFAFVPESKEHVLSVKKKIEHKLSSYEVRLTKSMFHLGSVQMDLFYKYDERKMLEKMLNMVNEIMAENSLAYNFFILIENSFFEKLYKFFEPSIFLIEKGTLDFSSLEEAYEKLIRLDSLPFGINYISKLVFIPPAVKRIAEIKTSFPHGCGEIKLGYFLENAAEKREIEISVEKNSFNLGTLITGMPGTGKTFAAMGIAEQLLKDGVPVVIISPTQEWSYFAVKNNMRLLRIYSSNNFRINFFKPSANVPVERFYENLAMLLASTSGAGPYRNSLEKALLAAFHRAYASGVPDPQELYNQIEEVVIEQHGKRTNVGVKYTKHGENIMASLENLRLLFSRPEFAYRDGLDFGELIKGTVFDLSNVSNNMKPFFYALILNQIYNIIDSFPEDGDDKLRLEIVLEESHLVFGADELSGPAADLKERIQDFRKKGIGLMLITHNIVDITPGIRRLCQTKLYFRQSPDMAKLAASDLGLGEDDALKLKFLGRGVSAIDYVNSEKGERSIEGPIFMKVKEYVLPNVEIKDEFSNLYKKISLSFSEQFEGKKAELYFLGEKIASSTIKSGKVSFDVFIKGKEYKLAVLGEHKRDTLFIKFRANAKNISFEEAALPK